MSTAPAPAPSPAPIPREQRERHALALLQQAAALPRPAFSTSFGAEDMVLLELIVRHRLPIEVFTLDTGRLHEETYRLMRQVEQRWGRIVQLHFPDAAALQQLVAQQGVNGFYDSVAQRRACCEVRKVGPLQRALAGRGAWVTGQRAAQAVTRAGLAAVERDEALGLHKFNPLHDWAEADVWEQVRAHAIPTNELHQRFYPSIGCAPCTRAVTPGEDLRAGRWWWEQPALKECGLHLRRDASRNPRDVPAAALAATPAETPAAVSGTPT
jgi:phosphoadenosine phosphosulfate reductase